MNLGRTLTHTRPDGEVLTYTYNARGLLESVSGDNTYADDDYVTGTDYTAYGAVDDQTLGNGVIADFAYDAWAAFLPCPLVSWEGYSNHIRTQLYLLYN